MRLFSSAIPETRASTQNGSLVEVLITPFFHFFFSLLLYSRSEDWEGSGTKPVWWSEFPSREITLRFYISQYIPHYHYHFYHYHFYHFITALPFFTIRVSDLDCLTLTSRSINSRYWDNASQEFADIPVRQRLITLRKFFFVFEISQLL